MHITANCDTINISIGRPIPKSETANEVFHQIHLSNVVGTRLYVQELVAELQTRITFSSPDGWGIIIGQLLR